MAPRKLRVAVTWTPLAREALDLMAARDVIEDAGWVKRGWNEALKSAARECVASAKPRRQAKSWAQRHAQADWSLDATFVSDEEMRELNGRFRHKKRPTDVLSFSQAEGALLDSEDSRGEVANPDAHEAHARLAEAEKWFASQNTAALGDLVIAVETAQRQADERAHTGQVEVLFLAIHGTLHLLGHDHQTSSQRRIMWREQEALFERLLAERVRATVGPRQARHGRAQSKTNDQHGGASTSTSGTRAREGSEEHEEHNENNGNTEVEAGGVGAGGRAAERGPVAGGAEGLG